jgi:hypothetical protein
VHPILITLSFTWSSAMVPGRGTATLPRGRHFVTDGRSAPSESPLPGAQSLLPGKYRLHTTSRIYSNPAAGTLDGTDDQTDSTGLNAFAIWSTNGGG